MRIVVCTACGMKNKIGGKLKGRSCKECGMRLDLQDRAPQRQKGVDVSSQKPSAPPIQPKPQKVSKKDVKKEKDVKLQQKYSGEFRQSGVLCIICKSITPFGKKKCLNCKKKLRINPRTTVYFNGVVQAIQCKKCGKYTDAKALNCEHCNKKLKF